MPNVVFLPLGISVFAKVGQSILDLAFENDIVIEHNCGGLCACNSCRVIIKKGMHLLKKISKEEKYILSNSGFLNSCDRLSCQCIIKKNSNEDIIVEIP